MVKEKTLVFFCLCFCHLVGVFGVDELKSVKEGDSVTLQTNVTEIQKDDLIRWMFGINRTVIARTDGVKNEFPYDLDGRFRDRLKLDEKTGSLTITNIRAEHAGVYEVEIRSSSSTHRFSVTVYAAPPTTKLPSSSNRTSGPASPSPSNPPGSETVIILAAAAAAGFLLIVATIVIFFIYRKHRKTDQQVEAREEEITYADTTFYKRNAPSVKKEEDVVYAGIVTRK